MAEQPMTIIHVGMDAFNASVEQHDHPELAAIQSSWAASRDAAWSSWSKQHSGSRNANEIGRAEPRPLASSSAILDRRAMPPHLGKPQSPASCSPSACFPERTMSKDRPFNTSLHRYSRSASNQC